MAPMPKTLAETWTAFDRFDIHDNAFALRSQRVAWTGLPDSVEGSHDVHDAVQESE